MRLTVFALLVAASPLAAQTSFGVLGGVVSSKVVVSTTGTTPSFSSRTGFALGAGMSAPLGAQVAITPEIMYVQKGYENTLATESEALRISYVEVPILAKVSFGKDKVRAFLIGGPEISVKVACQSSETLNGASGSESCDDAQVKFNSTDLGLIAGAGLEQGRLSGSVRFDLGLANILNEGANGSVKNQALMVLVRYALK